VKRTGIVQLETLDQRQAGLLKTSRCNKELLTYLGQRPEEVRLEVRCNRCPTANSHGASIWKLVSLRKYSWGINVRWIIVTILRLLRTERPDYQRGMNARRIMLQDSLGHPWSKYILSVEHDLFVVIGYLLCKLPTLVRLLTVRSGGFKHNIQFCGINSI
jgi:hypothetical protein